MRRFEIIGVLLFSAIAAAQGTSVEVQVPQHAPIDIAVVPALSVNALAEGGVADNNLALGLLAHRSRNLAGVGLAPFASLVDDTLRGVQVGLFSRARVATGVQAGFFTTAQEALTGAQLGAVNLSARTLGLQLGALINGTEGNLTGAQLGLGNIVGDDVVGLQVGVVNRGSDVSGVQIGAVNLARHSHGLMLGAFNVADSADVPIGLVSWIKDGEQHLAVFASETNVFNVATRLGTRRLHSTMVFGVGSSDGTTRFTWGAGLGARWHPGTRVFIEVEAVEQLVSFGKAFGGPSGLLTTARTQVGVQLLPRLAVTVGPALSLWVPLSADARLKTLMPSVEVGSTSNGPVLLIPGLAIGVQL